MENVKHAANQTSMSVKMKNSTKSFLHFFASNEMSGMKMSTKSKIVIINTDLKNFNRCDGTTHESSSNKNSN